MDNTKWWNAYRAPKKTKCLGAYTRVLARCAKISAAGADMRTGFRSHGVRSALQSESSSSGQPHIAMGASLIKNQRSRSLYPGIGAMRQDIRDERGYANRIPPAWRAERTPKRE